MNRILLWFVKKRYTKIPEIVLDIRNKYNPTIIYEGNDLKPDQLRLRMFRNNTFLLYFVLQTKTGKIKTYRFLPKKLIVLGGAIQNYDK